MKVLTRDQVIANLCHTYDYYLSTIIGIEDLANCHFCDNLFELARDLSTIDVRSVDMILDIDESYINNALRDNDCEDILELIGYAYEDFRYDVIRDNWYDFVMVVSVINYFDNVKKLTENDLDKILSEVEFAKIEDLSESEAAIKDVLNS